MRTSVTTNDTGAAVVMASASCAHHAFANAASCLGADCHLDALLWPTGEAVPAAREEIGSHQCPHCICGPISNGHHIHPTSGARMSLPRVLCPIWWHQFCSHLNSLVPLKIIQNPSFFLLYFYSLYNKAL